MTIFFFLRERIQRKKKRCGRPVSATKKEEGTGVMETMIKPAAEKVLARAKTAVYYGWIPLIVVLGMTTTEPAPSLLQFINPIA